MRLTGGLVPCRSLWRASRRGSHDASHGVTRLLCVAFRSRERTRAWSGEAQHGDSRFAMSALSPDVRVLLREQEATLRHSLVAARRKPSGDTLGQTGCLHLSIGVAGGLWSSRAAGNRRSGVFEGLSSHLRIVHTPKQRPPFTVAQQELEPSCACTFVESAGESPSQEV